jgi:hypothetical protein
MQVKTNPFLLTYSITIKILNWCDETGVTRYLAPVKNRECPDFPLR